MQSLPDFGGWCAFCQEKPSIGRNADGQPACEDCAKQLIEAQKKYEAEMAEVAGLHVGPNRKQRRAAMRQLKRRNDGSAWGG